MGTAESVAASGGRQTGHPPAAAETPGELRVRHAVWSAPARGYSAKWRRRIAGTGAALVSRAAHESSSGRLALAVEHNRDAEDLVDRDPIRSERHEACLDNPVLGIACP